MGGNGDYMRLDKPMRNYHMRDKWRFFFGPPLNMHYEFLGENVTLPTQCPQVAWEGFAEWALGPQRFVDLRELAFSRAGISATSPTEKVVVIKRGKLGAERRSLPNDFYDAAHDHLQ